MKLLLDTHIFLWYISGDSRLPGIVKDAIQQSANEVFLSAASVWEAVIKYALGKLPLPEPPAEYLPSQRLAHQIESLPIAEEALAHLAGLPSLHRDPFDRILIAQTLQHGMTLASVDDVVRTYPVPLLPPVPKSPPVQKE
jgi:PIN domain nuclease of toxin-antitoxin system